MCVSGEGEKSTPFFWRLSDFFTLTEITSGAWLPLVITEHTVEITAGRQ
jgi:hypothetical protein